ncbi:MAG: urate hydroxylase PuuD [Cognatishimia sp.]
MLEIPILWEWFGFALRWVHVITAIAWIGSSFYFIALDLGLHREGDLGGADGEEWQVHGGGFYHVRKYLTAPGAMPEHLTWFKWESYATWLSGFALLMVVYWAGGELYLIDANKSNLLLWQGILLSAAVLTIGWLCYDALCKSRLAKHPTILMLLLFCLLVAMGYGLNQVFTGRAMMLHLGALTATIMTANVFFIIMPNQRVVVADLQNGRVPDAKYGKIAKLRSTHNNYLTLPVIFLMLSNHYPLSFATQYNWLIAALVFLMGVTIRHFFNSMHARKGMLWWTWLVTVVLFILIMWLSSGGPAVKPLEEAEAEMPVAAQRFAEAQGFQEVRDIVLGRCSMCHARAPSWEGIHRAPKSIYLETQGEIAMNAHAIYLHAGLSDAMPPANVSWMEAKERAAIVAWYGAR